MPWDPSQYLKFEDQRLRPAIDLMNRIPLEHPSQIYDLGCGTGNITRLLKLRWPDAKITGVDDSAEMLQRAASEDGITWEQADWPPGSPRLRPTSFIRTPPFNGSPTMPGCSLRCWRRSPPAACSRFRCRATSPRHRTPLLAKPPWAAHGARHWNRSCVRAR